MFRKKSNFRLRKAGFLKKFIQKQVRQVVSSIIVSIQFFNKSQGPQKLFGTMPTTELAI